MDEPEGFEFNWVQHGIAAFQNLTLPFELKFLILLFRIFHLVCVNSDASHLNFLFWQSFNFFPSKRYPKACGALKI